MTYPKNKPSKPKTPEEQAGEKVFNVGCLGLIVLFAVIWIFSSIQSAIETPEQKAAKQAQVLNEWFESGSNISCENNLKEKLRDPNSYSKNGDFNTITNGGAKKVITWQFRATNGFGGYNISTGMCNVSKDNGGTISTTIVGQ